MSREELSVQTWPPKERISRKRPLDNGASHPVSAGSDIPQLRVQSVIRFAGSRTESQYANPYPQSNARSSTCASVPSPVADSPSECSTDSENRLINLQIGRFRSPAAWWHARITLFAVPVSGEASGLARDSVEILESTLSSHFVHSLHSPSTIDKYWEVVQARNTALENIIAGVTAAYEAAYGDQIAAFSTFMISALRDGLVPHQPQATPSRWLKLLAAFLKNTADRLAVFVSLLFGFRNLSEDDQRTLLVEKRLISYLIHYASYVRKGEYYTFFPGTESLHLCKYVIESLGMDPDYVRFSDSCYASVNSIGLTLVEL
ncbi:uncharacterized protein LOC129601147 [Paramacrobiotus metropolitanus]|uniref:uncharacterized protein LOC129601147 n=1 Tax=Paramacrobiotus metropolitanus TaxID=2943436 RepID=UPI0024463AA2|nr:uncharacterized protein LOC129601147 [Paramacrobiotus metropolitanus]XP_055355853.1 uncharacterized protein LOC129601147 [Paramacrobiotus metropolitanus]XP_055355854.1 uncharacterized protein LOC129601147 [Paramacrobiotus metropolitanus]XP_055355855.1 uncharacterized protein LOC129601147 [Paramacrobiotus metropolitanus]